MKCVLRKSEVVVREEKQIDSNSDLKVIQELALWGNHESKRPCSDGCVQQILDSVIELMRVRSRR